MNACNAETMRQNVGEHLCTCLNVVSNIRLYIHRVNHVSLDKHLNRRTIDMASKIHNCDHNHLVLSFFFNYCHSQFM